MNDQLTFTLGVNNGWNHIADDTQSQKTGEVGVSFTPLKQFILTAQGYFGDEPVGGGQVAQRDIVDVVATYNVNDSLSLVASYDWGQQKDYNLFGSNGKWDGVAVYVNYAISPQWRVSVRSEYFQDKQGFVTATSGAQTLKEGTVTLGYDPIKSFELRLEARYDEADNNLFLRDTSGTMADQQTGLALQMLYRF
jgi:Putative beta-barrel porin-2, OmpL-like. bbp2